METSVVRRRIWPALAVWAGLIAAAIVVGVALSRAGHLRIDHAPPFHATVRPVLLGLLPAVAAAALGVWLLPRAAARLPWPAVPWLTGAGAAAWAVLLAVSEGRFGLIGPVTHPNEYRTVLPRVGDDPLGWLGGFTGNLLGYPIHVQGHPPLPVLIAWALERLGAHGSVPLALLEIVVGASGCAAVVVTVRLLGGHRTGDGAGERTARAVAPYLVLTPFAPWLATTMDALFLGVGAWAMALATRAAVRGPAAAAAGAGLLLGALPYLSYGLLPLFALPAGVFLVVRPRPRVWAALIGAAAVVPALFTLAGFDWFAGAAATHVAWAIGAGAERPYAYFLFADFAVLAATTGPAVAVGVAAALRAGPRASRTVWLTAGSALLGAAALALAGVTRGEVERIWLPYAAWVMVAVAASGLTASRRALGAQAATGLLLQALLRSPW
ncbi:MAG: hypothetical protein GEV11_06555 [Streptosporangiales bacterium]|nr:hypothetical protein [Streptosporangiales bacterium]